MFALRFTSRYCWAFALWLILPLPQTAQTAADRLLEIESVKVTGTRLPAASVILLTGIKPHDKVNEKMVNEACHKITETGLVKTVDYAYDAYPDRPSVVLNLTIADEAPLVPATVKPEVGQEALWSSLQALDPIFTRTLPPTEKAVAFYAKGFERCLQAHGQSDLYAAPNLVADASGTPTAVTFEIRQYKTVSPRK